jgi:hypothetical protein
MFVNIYLNFVHFLFLSFVVVVVFCLFVCLSVWFGFFGYRLFCIIVIMSWRHNIIPLNGKKKSLFDTLSIDQCNQICYWSANLFPLECQHFDERFLAMHKTEYFSFNLHTFITLPRMCVFPSMFTSRCICTDTMFFVTRIR